jgi:hypothetical protein
VPLQLIKMNSSTRDLLFGDALAYLNAIKAAVSQKKYFETSHNGLQGWTN